MRRKIALIAGLAGWLALAGVSRARGQQVQVSAANRTISITTTESAERRAEAASLHIGYHLYAADSAQVYAQAAGISQAIVAALAKAGVAKDAIASEDQSTGPVLDYQNQNLSSQEREQRRFEAQQSWTVKTTPDAVARVLAASVDAGANTSGQIEWSVADDASLTVEANSKALAHARQIAAQMAKGLGAGVGNLLYASNQVEMARPIQRPRAMADVVAQAPPKLSLRAPIITRSATVSAIFAIE